MLPLPVFLSVLARASEPAAAIDPHEAPDAPVEASAIAEEAAGADEPAPSGEAEEGEHHGAHEEEHGHGHGVLAFRTTGGVPVGSEEAGLALGSGAAYETPELHHLALELAVGAAIGPEGTEVPVELLVERPFELGEHLEPYIGLGSTVVAAEETLRVGAVGALGAHVWLSRSLGVLLESDAVCLPGEETEVIVEGLTGLAVRLP